jgi:hypothetical protein
MGAGTTDVESTCAIKLHGLDPHRAAGAATAVNMVRAVGAGANVAVDLDRALASDRLPIDCEGLGFVCFDVNHTTAGAAAQRFAADRRAFASGTSRAHRRRRVNVTVWPTPMIWAAACSSVARTGLGDARGRRAGPGKALVATRVPERIGCDVPSIPADASAFDKHRSRSCIDPQVPSTQCAASSYRQAVPDK